MLEHEIDETGEFFLVWPAARAMPRRPRCLPAFPVSEAFDESPQGRAHLMPRGVVYVEAVKGRAPVIHDGDEATLPNVIGNRFFKHESQPHPVQCGSPDQLLLRQDQVAPHFDSQRTAVAPQFPTIDPAAVETTTDAVMGTQIAGVFWPRVPFEVFRRRDDHAAPRTGGAHRDHVGLKVFTETDPGIAAAFDDVFKTIGRADVEFDFRIAGQEVAQAGHDHLFECQKRQGDAQRTARLIGVFPGLGQTRGDLGQRGGHAGQQPDAFFGWPG